MTNVSRRVSRRSCWLPPPRRECTSSWSSATPVAASSTNKLWRGISRQDRVDNIYAQTSLFYSSNYNRQISTHFIIKQVCEKVAAKPKKVFDAVNKIWRNESDIEKIPPPKTAVKKKKSQSKRPEDLYKTCDYCRRKFCENAFDRHVEFCKEKSTRLSSSPVKDVVAQAKLFARTRYNPKEAKNGEDVRKQL